MRTYSQMRKRLRVLVDEHNAALPKQFNRTLTRLYTPSTASKPRITGAMVKTAETLIEILMSNNRHVHNPTDVGKTWLNIYTKSLAKATCQSQRTVQRHILALVQAEIITDRIVTKAIFFMRNWLYQPTEILLNKKITGNIRPEKVTVENQSVSYSNLTSQRHIEPNGIKTISTVLEASDSFSKSSFSNAATPEQVVTNSLNSKKTSSEKNNISSGAENFAKSAKDLLWSDWEHLTENQYQALLTAYDAMEWKYGCTPAEALATMRRTRNRMRVTPEYSCKIVAPTKYFGTASEQNKFTFSRSLEIYRNRINIDSRRKAYPSQVRDERDVRHTAKPLSSLLSQFAR